MGLLDHLWDDTLAGPLPDSGLGKLRKHATFAAPPDSLTKDLEIGGNSSGSGSAVPAEDAPKVTRSIMIVKPPGYGFKDSPPASPSTGTPPLSPAVGTPPISPFFGSKKDAAFRFRRKSASFAYEKASGVGPRSPPPPYL